VRQQAAKQQQARGAGEWLAGEIESMRQKVADAEAKVD
jgi:polysaccharide biosynthesis transport protein